MTGTLKVTPDKLTSTASEFKNKSSKIRSMTQEMLQIVNSMNGIWEGEAQTTFAQRFKALDGDMAQIKLKIDEHVSDLNEMANTYKTTESAMASNVGALNTDFIS